jgi:phenylacetate-CoA ligase
MTELKAPKGVEMSGAVGGETGASAARSAYERLRAAHLSAVQAALEDHITRLEWPRERIERYRDQRLRALLAYARERSPFYAARLADLDPATATVGDLARLPVLTKRDVLDQWDAIVTVPGLDLETAERTLAEQEWYSYTPADQQVFSSGGSSGVRGVYVWDWQLFITLACLAWRTQAREERRNPPPLRGRPRLAVLEAGKPPHAGTPLFDVPTVPGMETSVIPAGAPFGQILAAVAAARPTHLVGFPSVIGQLARAALAGELEINPVRVSTNSEPLTDEDRQVIGAAWNVPVHNLWGSTEIGVQAVGCAHGDGLHVCEDEVVLERVDRDGTPVAPDQPASRVLATGLADRTFPFIRYDLGDEVTYLTGRCACGSQFARLASVAGRRDDDFHYPDGTVPAGVFRHALGLDPRLSEYQVRQTPDGAEILAVGSPDTAELATSLTAALRRVGLPDPQIQIRTVDRIQRNEATGKLRRFIALPDRK